MKRRRRRQKHTDDQPSRLCSSVIRSMASNCDRYKWSQSIEEEEEEEGMDQQRPSLLLHTPTQNLSG